MSHSHDKKVSVEDMPESALDDVLSIEQKCTPFPWERERLVKFKNAPKNNILIAKTPLNREFHIVGFAAYERCDNYINLSRFCVLEDFREAGVKEAMFERIQSRMNLIEFPRAKITIHERDTDMLLFMKECGFRAPLFLRNVYPETNDGAVSMECELPWEPSRYANEFAAHNRISQHFEL